MSAPSWTIDPTHPAVRMAGAVPPKIAERMVQLGIQWTEAPAPIVRRCRTPGRTAWLSTEIDVQLVCSGCRDYAHVGSTTQHAPTCSCLPMAVLAAERDTARLACFADARAARAGRCCIDGCVERGTVWSRSTTPAGVRAVRTCAAHEMLGDDLLRRVTIEEAVRLATPAQVRRARALAEASDRAADSASRDSAAMRGASSATHSAALVAGWHGQEAIRQRAFAAAVDL